MADTPETHIEFEQVRKAYGDAVVLDGVDLAVRKGEKLVILGRSGSGKTTILRVLMTLEKPDNGFVRIGGSPLWHEEKGSGLKPATEKHLRKMRSLVGMVFQHYTLFPNMTVLRNVTEAPVHVAGIHPDEAHERAMSLLELVGMHSFADRKPQQLSGGQRQRVAIARALALRPEVLLFDEVTSALDPELVGEVLSVIQDIAANSGTTMLIVTHEMSFARRVADRVVMFDNGKIIEAAPPAQFFGSPEHERTRTFLKALEH